MAGDACLSCKELEGIMMKYVSATKIDSIEDYALCEGPRPSLTSGQILVEVKACAMGYVDALVALGGYQVKPPLPFTPGNEFAGLVAARAADVSELAVGDRVMVNLFGGGLAQFCTAPTQAVQAIPNNMTFEQAAGFRVNYLTALHALQDRAAAKPGERMLVMGAAGGVGSAAIQLGKLLGLHVIAAASSKEKRAFAKEVGADETIDTEPDGWRDRLKDAYGGGGPDIVFDPVGGPLFEQTYRSINWGGRHLVIGFVGGPIPKLPINLALLKGNALIGVDVRQFQLFQAKRANELLGQLLKWVEAGQLSPPIGRRFPLSDFAAAMQFAISGQGMGKSIVTVDC
jgi:NADPH:quinone reductase